jgi:hypothetical protein
VEPFPTTIEEGWEGWGGWECDNDLVVGVVLKDYPEWTTQSFEKRRGGESTVQRESQWRGSDKATSFHIIS